MAKDLSHLGIHKLYVPDFCDSSSHPEGPGAFFAASFSQLFEEDAKNFAVLSRIEAHRFLLQNHWTDCDLTRSDVLLKFSTVFGVDSLLFGSLSSDINSYSIDFLLRDLSGKPLLRSSYVEHRDPMMEGDFPAAAGPSGWPFYFIHHDGVRAPRCVKCWPQPSFHKAGVTAVIVVSVFVNTRGEMEQFRLIKKVDPKLDAAAVRTLKSWRFSPAKGPDGAPVPVRLSFAFGVAPK
jgi:TonB family protein